MRTRSCAAALALFALVGCGDSLGRVKGRVVQNGQPMQVEGQAALMFYLLGPDGKPDPEKSYPVPLNPDGTFELLASGGRVPAGNYLLTVEVNAKPGNAGIAKYKGRYTLPNSGLRAEVKSGSNDLVVDLEKPTG